mgnify:CR=1 FL=1
MCSITIAINVPVRSLVIDAIGVFVVSDGSDKPYRVKVRPPSFCNLVGLRPMMSDAYIADAVAILGSLDIVLGEVDR